MFYYISTDEGIKKKFAYAIGVTEWPQKAISCPKCKREWQKSLMYELSTDIPVVLSNDNYPDFLWYYIDHISENAKNVLEFEKITGYMLEKANVLSVSKLSKDQIKELRNDGFKVNKIPENPPIYYKLHVSLGAEYHEKSNVVLKENCDYCGYEFYGIKDSEPHIEKSFVLKKNSWNGKDLFIAKGYGHIIFCTEHFKEVYYKNNLSGLCFTEIEVL